MRQLKKNKLSNLQDDVAKFYDGLIFPSRFSHKEYENIVPDNLKGLTIGDFGCGQSLFIEKFKRLECHAIFIDISKNVLDTINYGKRIQASLDHIPLKDYSVHMIFCIGVVHHIPEIEHVISELIRVLKKEGKLFLGVYAPKSINWILRKTYEAIKISFIQKIIYALATFLIWIKNRKNGLRFKSIENFKRTDDLLKTPIVKYLPLSFYYEILSSKNCRITGVKRISSTNIITIEK